MLKHPLRKGEAKIPAPQSCTTPPSGIALSYLKREREKMESGVSRMLTHSEQDSEPTPIWSVRFCNISCFQGLFSKCKLHKLPLQSLSCKRDQMTRSIIMLWAVLHIGVMLSMRITYL